MRKDTANWIALEKLLKAHVAEITQTVPIKTHDLIYLLKKCELKLPENRLDFIGKINTASIPTRYPDDLQRSLKEYPKSVANDYLNQTIELVQWLKQHPNLSGRREAPRPLNLPLRSYDPSHRSFSLSSLAGRQIS